MLMLMLRLLVCGAAFIVSRRFEFRFIDSVDPDGRGGCAGPGLVAGQPGKARRGGGGSGGGHRVQLQDLTQRLKVCPGDAPCVAAVQLVEHVSEVTAQVSRQMTASTGLLCTRALEPPEVSCQSGVEMSPGLRVVVSHTPPLSQGDLRGGGGVRVTTGQRAGGHEGVVASP